MRADAFDFWLGEWDCAWQGGGGTNAITRELGGSVVVERFEALAPEPFSGMSVSVHDPRAGAWNQTWVDSNGSYWHFVGAQDEGELIFRTPEPVDADEQYKRMVFSQIGTDTFHWRWEASSDARSWTERWAIDYRRRVPG